MAFLYIFFLQFLLIDDAKVWVDFQIVENIMLNNINKR